MGDRAGHSDPELWDLERLADARRLGDWMFDQVAPEPGSRVAEIGAGIGTFTTRLLEQGAKRVLAVEPEPACAEALDRRFGGDSRVDVAQELLPDSPTLRAVAGSCDLVLCQNVLEHIPDDRAAVGAMRAALRPGGRLVLLVPAHPGLYGPLDERFGHHRRYDRRRLRAVVTEAGLELEDLYPFNALGILGWWVKNRRPDPNIDQRSLRAYEKLVAIWRPLEERLRPPWGLSLIARARRPAR